MGGSGCDDPHMAALFVAMTFSAADAGVPESLRLYRFRADLRLEQDLRIPSERRGIVWRGAFGFTFRKLVCHDLQLDCMACQLLDVCTYPKLFAPRVPEGRQQPKRLASPPLPIVLTDPFPEAPSLRRDEPTPLDIVVVGSAQKELPYILATIRRLGEDGIGPDRVRFQVSRCQAVDAAGVAVYDVFLEGTARVRAHHKAIRPLDLALPGDDGARRVRVTFRTATELRHQGEVTTGAPPFGVLFRRLRDRIGALSTFYGDEGLNEATLASLSPLADGVRIVASDVRSTSLIRRSSRTGERHPVGGILGSVVYEGEEVRRFMPWLRVGALVGVGKHATFGGGRVRVEVVG